MSSYWPEDLIIPSENVLRRELSVEKIGAKTGKTEGSITYVNDSPMGNFTVETYNGTFAQKGDSGSLVTTIIDGQRLVLGVVVMVAGLRTFCYNFKYMFDEVKRQMARPDIKRNNIRFLRQHECREISTHSGRMSQTTEPVSLADSGIGSMNE